MVFFPKYKSNDYVLSMATVFKWLELVVSETENWSQFDEQSLREY